MAETPNYGLFVIPPEDTSRALMDWTQRMDGTSETSNMMLIDKLLAALQAEKANNVVESDTEPSDQDPGDEWDRLL